MRNNDINVEGSGEMKR